MENKPHVEKTPEILEAILEQIVLGNSFSAIEKLAGMPCRETISRWYVEDKEFQAKVWEMFGGYFGNKMLDVIKIADGTGEEDKALKDGDNKLAYAIICRDKLKVDTRIKIASKLIPKYFGDKIDVNIGGEVEMKRTILYPHKLPVGAPVPDIQQEENPDGE